MKNFDKDLFAKLLKEARGKRSINHYGALSNVDPSYISRLERNLVVNPPSPEIISKLAQRAYGVTYEDFMEAAGYISMDKEYDKQESLPLRAAERTPEYSCSDDMEELAIGEFFTVLAQDDGMEGSRILSGDRVLVKRENKVEDGEIVLILLDKRPILRRLYYLDGRYILRPDNPDYKLEVVSGEEIKVVGKVVQVQFTI